MTSLPDVRRAAVAGTWYPSRPDRLTAEVETYLASVDIVRRTRPIALIAPHAGLLYSGSVAAHAYATLRGQAVDLAVLIGPSHYVAFEGVSVYPQGAFETPLGPALIDARCAAALLDTCPAVRVFPGAHAREHSLEMQLPFLKRVLPDARVVPLVMGHQTRETALALADAVAGAVKDRNSVIIASTDLSHYHDAVSAARLDAEVMRHIEPLDAAGLMSLLERRPDHACGGGPTVAAMLAARHLGATAGRILCYGDSGDVSGDKTSVVGYLAAALESFPASVR